MPAATRGELSTYIRPLFDWGNLLLFCEHFVRTAR